MTANGENQQVSLKLLVQKRENRVILVEAGKDFVDVLLSFLTLPLGTIARLVGKDSNMQPVRVGCLNALYESVANLEEETFWTKNCKEMLLQPRNSMEAYSKNLKLNIDDTQPMNYFICENLDCSPETCGFLSTFRNTNCRCGKMMNGEITIETKALQGLVKEGYVLDNATFVINEGLHVMPNDHKRGVVELLKLGCEEMIVNVSKREVVDLLKCSLLSETPLTDVFLKKKKLLEKTLSESLYKIDLAEQEANNNWKMTVNIVLRKSDNKVLFAFADDDFADFLFSFLTFPLGGVENMLKGRSCLGSIDNLYNSLAELKASKYFRSPNLQNMLLNPGLASKFKLNKQVLPIEEMEVSSGYFYFSNGLRGSECLGDSNSGPSNLAFSVSHVKLSYLDPKSSKMEECSSTGFSKGPSMYMITDDLIVTLGSSISAVSFLNEAGIPPHDLEERVVSFGTAEGLSILKAALTSSSALTDALRHLIRNEETNADTFICGE